MAEAHPEYSVRTGHGLIVITAPDGTERRLTGADFRTLNRRLRSEPPAEPAAEPEPAPVQERVWIEPGPVPVPEPPVAPPVPDAATVARTTLSAALTQEVLADILRHASEAISELDGAGPAGAFSRTEAAQIAYLIYDPTLDLVQRYFGGDVNKFKLFLAVFIILLAKGKVHAKAISRKLAERRAASAEPEPAVDPEAQWAAESDAEPTDPEAAWLQALAAKQKEWAE